MTWIFQQLDQRGSLNLPADWKQKYDMKPKGVSVACLDCNGVIVMVPLMGDAHQVYQAHGENGLREWVNQRSGLTLPTVFTPAPPKSKEERKADLQEKRILLRHDLKMQQMAAAAALIRLRQAKAEAFVAAQAERRAARYAPPPPLPPPTPEEVEKFQTEQAQLLSADISSPLPQA